MPDTLANNARVALELLAERHRAEAPYCPLCGTAHAPPELRAERFDPMSQAELIALLKNLNSNEFEKAHAMMRLRVIGTAEAVPFSRETTDSLISLAEKGIRQLFEAQQAVLGSL